MPHLIGRLCARIRKNKESATFEYDEGWLKHLARFSLEPALQLGPGPFHTLADTPMFGAIGDSAPDRCGRALMRRMERRHLRRWQLMFSVLSCPWLAMLTYCVLLSGTINHLDLFFVGINLE